MLHALNGIAGPATKGTKATGRAVGHPMGYAAPNAHGGGIKVRLRFDRGLLDVAIKVRATYFLHKNRGGTSKYISNYPMGLRGFEGGVVSIG